MPKVIKFSRGSVVYFTDDTKDERIFILQSGTLAMSSHDIISNEEILEQVKPGEFFGVKSSLGHFPREETISALSDCVVIALNADEFTNILDKNHDVAFKMLKVFSQQLRMVHRKTEAILKNSAEIDQPSGMYSVAKSFFKDGQFRSCCDVCAKLLTRFPDTAIKPKVAQLYSASKMKYSKSAKKAQRTTAAATNTVETNSLLKTFDLPAFERFAKNYAPDQVIISEFEPGDCFYLIQSGSVQLVKCVNDTKQNLDILKPGEFFGEMAILDNSPRSATCVAINDVKVLEFNKANFKSLIMDNPQLSLLLMKLFCRRIYDQKRRLRTLTITDLQTRVYDVFLMVDEMNPQQNTQGISRKFNLTTADVAHWAGLSVDTTEVELRRLSERKKIEISEKHITVRNFPDLKRTVEKRLSQKAGYSFAGKA